MHFYSLFSSLKKLSLLQFGHTFNAELFHYQDYSYNEISDFLFY